LTNMPKVSFAIPTFNSERTLDKCLSSINGQDYPDVELVVVDGFSRDRTVRIAREYTDKVYSCKGCLGQARQMSIEKSRGEILALFDDDIIIPHERWLSYAVSAFGNNPKTSTVWPLVVPPPRASLTSKCYTNYSNAVKIDRLVHRRGVIGGTNALFRRKCIERIGGFNPKIGWGEDFDIARKLKAHGYRVVFHKDPLYHDTMSTLGEFATKQIKGARAFLPSEFSSMEMGVDDLLYEHLVVGNKSMIRGLVVERDCSWSLLPIFTFIRMIVYGGSYISATS
jgi:glycosyltransferase involved in cell wall biosynthesis